MENPPNIVSQFKAMKLANPGMSLSKAREAVTPVFELMKIAKLNKKCGKTA
jgi:hypothetical protein